jgi:diacylglycerol O-acyltransferase
MTTDTMQWPNRMNPTDALFWSMDKIPEMRSTIGALVILEGAPSRERVREHFERLSYELVRMRQRVVQVPFALAPPEWVDDAQFDLDYHLRTLAVPQPCDMEQLLEEISPFYATAFDRERPLWEAYLVEGLVGGRGAVFVKMHHCLTDGVGGARLSESLLSEHVDSSHQKAPRAPELRSTTPAALVVRAAWHNLEEGLAASRVALESVIAAAKTPQATWRSLRHSFKTVTGFGQELSVMRADSPLHQQRSLSRRLSTFEMALSDIDGARAQLGATNNDIVLTIVSGAMHRWHTSRGHDARQLRALVPVSLRGPDDPAAGNRLALLAVSLPTGEPNPVRRLRVIQERMGQVKTDRRATLYPLLARLMIAMPTALAERIGRQQTQRTNFVCTNVPGPRRTCFLAGVPIEKLYPYAPLVGDHPVAIALYSYRDTMYVGLDVDALAMEDLPHFRDAVKESYEEILNVGHQTDRRRSVRTGRRPQPERGVRPAS